MVIIDDMTLENYEGKWGIADDLDGDGDTYMDFCPRPSHEMPRLPPGRYPAAVVLARDLHELQCDASRYYRLLKEHGINPDGHA